MSNFGPTHFAHPMRGFSIVELMVTVVVAAILVAVALPSFRELTIRSNTTQTANGLVSDLNLARSEAVRRGVQVEVVSVSKSKTWTGGWAVLADDPVNTGTFPTTIKNSAAAPTNFSVCGKANSPTGAAGDQNAIFGPLGSLNNASGVDVNVNRPDGNAAQSLHISVSPSGEITSIRGTSSSPALTSC